MSRQYILSFIKKLRQRKKILISMVSVIFAVLPLVFYVCAYIETVNIGKDLLGESRYNERISDAGKYALVMAGIFSLFLAAALFIINRFINSYISILNSLDEGDISKLKEYNDIQLPLSKYTVPFIFQKNTLHIFNMGKVTSIKGSNIVNYEIEKIRSRNGFFYRLNINTRNGNYKHTMYNIDKQAAMLQEDIASIMYKTSN
ncbi:hypothetical protein I6H88_13380 [Elizabethkingia bruuniana]|uniref:Uncharacterized protein n=2 Tax=Elizabethkingia bruuniana TaxID=1756149 RepID=A0A7T7UWD8_9FLAO|nr:hypothetical protein AYC65_02480 [Elizabethkingia bruuniana]KGO08616.1 hypothetical protein KS04_18795 [Elizabethkingia miricola]KUY28205.1 hypothetical protein ATB97_14865 [Elizabethkingia bruuniana]OPB64373.1 hypothetical protein BAY12_06120 [Elizabethkingia bruuniana]QDZ63308.1 hypothetical protein EVD20_12590 [Elizabethkingia bruuniana]